VSHVTLLTYLTDVTAFNLTGTVFPGDDSCSSDTVHRMWLSSVDAVGNRRLRRRYYLPFHQLLRSRLHSSV